MNVKELPRDILQEIAAIVPTHLSRLNEVCKSWAYLLAYQPIEVSCSNPLRLLMELSNSKRKMIDLSSSILEEVSSELLLDKITEWLQHDKCISILDLSYNSLGKLHCDALEKFAQNVHSSTLEMLNLAGNSIITEEEYEIKGIVKLIEVKNNLTYLNLELNSISTNGIRVIMDILSTNEILKTFIISDNDINDDGAIAIASMISKNSTLTKLDLSGNRIGDTGGDAIARALQKNTSITELYVLTNMLTYKSSRLFCKKKTVAVSGIDECDGNYLGKGLHAEDCSLIAWDLTNFETVAPESLILACNSIDYNRKGDYDETGIIDLCEALKLNSNVKSLECGDMITDDCTCILKMMLTNKSITKLALSSCNIDCENIDLVTDMLLKNKTLKALDLSCNNLNNMNSYKKSNFAFALKQNDSLKELYMINVSLQDESGFLLAKSIALNESITTLNLAHNYFNKRQTLDAFKKCFMINTTLKCVILYDSFPSLDTSLVVSTVNKFREKNGLPSIIFNID